MALRRHGTPDTSRFEGFRGAFDKAAGTFVFESKDERDRFQREKYGAVRNGYREEHEATDDRPLLIYPEPFWESFAEMAAWLKAVQSCPIAEYGGMDAFAYLGEVGQVAVGLGGKVKRMPHVRMSRVERDRQLAKLRGQIPRGTEIL